METWRLLDTGARSAAENMALDEVLLELKAQERIPHTLRFLQFSRPSVLVGHRQSVEEEVRLDYCLEKMMGSGLQYCNLNNCFQQLPQTRKKGPG
jgi:lipoate-protein ligase A